MSSHYRWLVIILLITGASIWISLPDTQKPDFLLRGGNEERLTECLEQVSVETECDQYRPSLEFSQGLDIVGGLRVLLEAELPEDRYTVEDLQETANNVGRRVNALGLAEATIQLQGGSRILVELPGVTDPEQAVETIQQTALLEFVDFGGLGATNVQNLEGQHILTTEQVLVNEQRLAAQAESTAEPDSSGEAAAPAVERLVNPRTGQPFDTILTGNGLNAAVATLQNNRWVIQFELTNEAGEIFGPFTASRIGEPLAIVLDGEVLSAPTINAQLTTGGIIEGNFTEDEAKTLALQLRSGALPIPLRVESAEQVGATLGQESVSLSIRAGVVGVIVVLSFMFIYYRVPGISADLALLVFIILNLALFKLIPITLTLPAIVGFLISIGTAVDGNILIFERLKEELRDGKSLDEALDSGFDRAWTSIRDSNISTIIICAILFFFGQTPGASIVSGFALTLALGLILNLFTAVVVTRTFLYLIVRGLHQTVDQRRWLLGI